MLKITRLLLVITLTSLIFMLAACSDDSNLDTEVQVAQISTKKDIPTAETNKEEIEQLKEQLLGLVEANEALKRTLENRVSRLEDRVLSVESTVTKNTGIIESLKLQLSNITNKVKEFFKPKKVASKKTYKKKKNTAVVRKPKYKVIGIDQWGAYKYVQLMDAQGNLRLLRHSESVDGWTVNLISKKKVTLVNARGHVMVLKPQA